MHSRLALITFLDEGYPAHPIAPGGSPGVPTHPIYNPPGIWGGGPFPTPPIYHPGHPDHGKPSHPIAPGGGVPTHPIAPGGEVPAHPMDPGAVPEPQ